MRIRSKCVESRHENNHLVRESKSLSKDTFVLLGQHIALGQHYSSALIVWLGSMPPCPWDHWRVLCLHCVLKDPPGTWSDSIDATCKCSEHHTGETNIRTASMVGYAIVGERDCGFLPMMLQLWSKSWASAGGRKGAHVRPPGFCTYLQRNFDYFGYYNMIFNLIIEKTLNSLGNYLKLTHEA